MIKGPEITEFSKSFQWDLASKKCLNELQLSKRFTCRKCGHHAIQIRKDHDRSCNKCSDTGSAGSDTLFHQVKFGLLKTFHSFFEMSSSTKGISIW